MANLLWPELHSLNLAPEFESLREAIRRGHLDPRKSPIESFFSPSLQLWRDKVAQAHRDMERALEHGFRCVDWFHPDYPDRLRRSHEAPLAFMFYGDLSLLRRPTLAVVGSREPWELSVRWMNTELTNFLSRNDVVIVSGGARGIDQLAHRLAVVCKRPTLVVLPSGLLR
ncbi:MAG: DNA-protecting protein DprA, partial [Bdellovibrionaceae bacterium]|nr:DNA-protecting protein DprA [Pseudobdellovibrionaceae bacterium]